MLANINVIKNRPALLNYKIVYYKCLMIYTSLIFALNIKISYAHVNVRLIIVNAHFNEKFLFLRTEVGNGQM